VHSCPTFVLVAWLNLLPTDRNPPGESIYLVDSHRPNHPGALAWWARAMPDGRRNVRDCCAS
jgi:hypothetical protein